MGQEWKWNSCFDGRSGLQDGVISSIFKNVKDALHFHLRFCVFFLGFVPIVLGSDAHLFKVLGSIVVGLLCALAAEKALDDFSKG